MIMSSCTASRDVKEGLCAVCQDKSAGNHYGALVCQGCKGFFKRANQTEVKNLRCYLGADCPVTIETRNNCRACRFQKCLKIGMVYTEKSVTKRKRQSEQMCQNHKIPKYENGSNTPMSRDTGRLPTDLPSRFTNGQNSGAYLAQVPVRGSSSNVHPACTYDHGGRDFVENSLVDIDESVERPVSNDSGVSSPGYPLATTPVLLSSDSTRESSPLNTQLPYALPSTPNKSLNVTFGRIQLFPTSDLGSLQRNQDNDVHGSSSSSRLFRSFYKTSPVHLSQVSNKLLQEKMNTEEIICERSGEKVDRTAYYHRNIVFDSKEDEEAGIKSRELTENPGQDSNGEPMDLSSSATRAVADNKRPSKRSMKVCALTDRQIFSDKVIEWLSEMLVERHCPEYALSFKTCSPSREKESEENTKHQEFHSNDETLAQHNSDDDNVVECKLSPFSEYLLPNMKFSFENLYGQIFSHVLALKKKFLTRPNSVREMYYDPLVPKREFMETFYSLVADTVATNSTAVAEFCCNLPGMNLILDEDKEILSRHCYHGAYFITCFSPFYNNDQLEVFIDIDGTFKCTHRFLRFLLGDKAADEGVRLSRDINRLNLSISEVAILAAIYMTAPVYPNVKQPERIAKLHMSYKFVLKQLIHRRSRQERRRIGNVLNQIHSYVTSQYGPAVDSLILPEMPDAY